MTSERNPEMGFMNQKKKMQKMFPLKWDTRPMKIFKSNFNQAMEERHNPYRW